MSDMEQTIRERAYHLWNNAGRPDGQCDAFWLSAQRDVLAMSIESTAARIPGKVAKASRAAKANPPAKAKAKAARRKAA